MNAYKYWDIDKDKLICRLCPRNCVFKKDGDLGFCRARKREANKIIPYKQDEFTAVHVDPIEKKPLYHFYPGKKILSLGKNFCNLACKFCQNFTISQHEAPTQKIELETILSYEGYLIAFTYDEPLMAYDYFMDILPILKENGKKIVFVSNGVINPIYFKNIVEYIDAFNIDIKSYENDFYHKIALMPGDILEILFENIAIAKKRAHVELTYLLIPGHNDNREQFAAFIKKISELFGKSQVLHISRFFPNYKMLDVPPTPLELLTEFYKIAKNYLYYVYLGNVLDEEYSTTYCPNCGEPLIERYGYSIVNRLTSQYCPNCNEKIDIIL